MLLPKSPEGHTAWDIANAMWGELYQIRRLAEDQGEDAIPRWLNLTGDAYAGGALTTTGLIRVPPGCSWTALAISGSSGGVGADTVEIFRNSPTDAGFITGLTAVNGRFRMVNLPDHLVLQENTILIARVTILAAADGLFPTINVATHEVHHGPPPQETREGGESIMTQYGDEADAFPEREDRVEYDQPAAGNGGLLHLLNLGK